MSFITPLLARSLFPSLYNGMDDGNGNVHFDSINQLPLIIANVIQIIITLVAALSIIFVMYAGVQYVISQGDPQKVAGAKVTITNAIVGVILSASAYLIVDFLARQF